MKSLNRTRLYLATIIDVAAATTSVTAASAQAAPAGWLVGYAARVQNIGWQPEVYDDAIAGTTGQCLRMEALTVQLDSQLLPPGASVCCRAHVQNIGWKPEVCNGAGQGRPGRAYE